MRTAHLITRKNYDYQVLHGLMSNCLCIPHCGIAREDTSYGLVYFVGTDRRTYSEHKLCVCCGNIDKEKV